MGENTFFKHFDHTPIKRAVVDSFGDLAQFDMVDTNSIYGVIEYPCEILVKNAIDDPDVLQEQSALYIWDFLKKIWIRSAKEEVDIEPLLTQTSIVQNGKIELENIPNNLEVYSWFIYEEKVKPDGSGTYRLETTPKFIEVKVIDEVAYGILPNNTDWEGHKVIYKTKPFASLLNGVMNITQMDDFPVENSDLPVKSKGIFKAINDVLSQISENLSDRNLVETTYNNESEVPTPTNNDVMLHKRIYIIETRTHYQAVQIIDDTGDLIVKWKEIY